jgi:hypothetical protein
MHEDKFEKQVSEKMDQLGFDPSDAVWLHIDKEINEEKKKRKPIFWIFLLSGLLIAGGGIYIVSNYFNSVKKTSGAPVQSEKTNQDNQQKEQQAPSAALPVMSRGKKIGSFQSGNKSKNISETLTLTGKPKIKTEKNDLVDEGIKQESENIVQAPVQPGTMTEQSINGENPDTATSTNGKTNNNLVADSVPDIRIIEKKDQKLKKSTWNIGFTAGAGISNINQSFFQSQNPAGIFASPANNAGTPATVHTPSESSSGFSFTLGVFFKRNLSKRFSASAGLGYHYYSTGIRTGISVDSALTVNYSYALTSSVRSYYRNGDGKEFTNQFHFIELPVNLSFQLNKSQRNPVNWEAGLSLAWLINTNALHFDPYNNVYFENSQLFNKIQWHVASAVLVGFSVHRHTIQVGPQIQYGLTSLLKNSGSYPGHLTYLGLKCSFSP